MECDKRSVISQIPSRNICSTLLQKVEIEKDLVSLKFILTSRIEYWNTGNAVHVF